MDGLKHDASVDLFTNICWQKAHVLFECYLATESGHSAVMDIAIGEQSDEFYTSTNNKRKCEISRI